MEKTNNNLGKRGYTIIKEEYPSRKLNETKKNLSVKPFINSDYGGNAVPFSIYMESKRKLYLPRYYGIEHFGSPDKITLNEGIDVNIKFKGKLKPFQEPISKSFMDTIKNKDFGGGIISVPCGYGKCLAKGTKVLMGNGTIKNVEDIKVDDVLMGDDSTPRNVLSLANGIETMYKISDEYGDSYTVNESHIISIIKYTENRYYKNDINIKRFFKLSTKEQQLWKGYRRTVYFPKHLCVPYKCNKIIEELDETIECIPNKFIVNSMKVRFMTLRFIIHKYNLNFNESWENINECRLFIKKSPNYIDSLKLLVQTMGINIHVKYNLSTGESIVRIWGYNLNYLNHKSGFLKNKMKLLDINPYEMKITKLDEQEYYGFMIDGNRRFLLGNCVVTHNTVLGLELATKIKKKTLIIVHKTFLMNQWEERIAQFIPTAKVGKIQGDVIDKTGCDIVIGMLQSISMKDYDDDMFNEFGFVIFDECHHLGAEVFSRALLKINARYTLGLSATPTRIDGLTKVFHWYLGPTIYQIKKRDDKNVLVHLYKYVNDNKKYCNEVRNYMGKLNMAQMINNITEFEPRIHLIFGILEKHLKEGRKILLLSDRRNHLSAIVELIENYIFTYGDEQFPYTFGYYLGGMKQCDLEITEKKDVILATFSMASEGFDCREPLDTIILASPKTNIEQSVGRILRQDEKDRKFIPLIIDINDCFSLFKRQAQKRTKYYKSNNYIIKHFNESGAEMETHGKKKKTTPQYEFEPDSD